MDDLLDDDIARELAERMKLFIFATDLPVSRLSRDVAGVERFEAVAGPLTPQLRLICASPPLAPAAAAIVDGAVRTWRDFLFRETGAYLTLVDGQGRLDCGSRVFHPHDEGLSGKRPDS